MTNTTTDPYTNAETAAAAIRDRFGIDRIDVGLVLGSGWKSGVDELGEPLAECPLEEIPGFLPPVVAGHGGRMILVRTPSDKIAAILTGRTHYYEMRGVAAVAHGVRTLAAAGAKTMVLTNGCGGLDVNIAPGTPVLLRDHINLTAATPIVGPRFVDLTDAYSPRLRDLARTVDPSLTEGVYVQFPGPDYETPAEVRMAGIIGGTLVGMSTTLETIAAREAGMEVLGISLVTNLAAGISPEPLDHQEVIEMGEAAGPRLAALIKGILEAI